MIKLLFVIMHLHMGGAERSLVNLLSEIDYNKYEVDLLLIKKEGELIKQLPKEVRLLDASYELKSVYSNSIEGVRGIKYFLIRGISVICSNIRNKIHPCDVTAIRWKYFYCRFIPNLVKKYDVAIAFLNGPSMYYVADKVNANKKIVFYHNDYFASNSMPNRPTDLLYFKKFDLIPTISEQCSKSLKRVFPDMEDKFIVIPNITSTRLVEMRAEEFYPDEYNDKKNILCSIGRLNEQKGFDLAIQAAVLLKQKGIHYFWFVIGEGEERSNLQELITSNQLEDYFFLLGIRNNPYPYLKYADVIVQPSRFEGKSMVLDEAKILAKSIVSTNYSTVLDQLNNNEGLVVEMTSEGIADGIQKMLSNEEMRKVFSTYLQQRDYGNTDEMNKFYDALK